MTDSGLCRTGLEHYCPNCNCTFRAAVEAAPAPEGEALRKLQAIPCEDFWRVYDQCREIQKLAQGISEFVDLVANMIPDEGATAGARAPASEQDIRDDVNADPTPFHALGKPRYMPQKDGDK